jgi:xanthine/uracil permease
VLAIPIFLCLLVGPRAKWVKRFLPSTANRIVFVVIVVALIVAWIVEGTGSVSRGDRGGYVILTFAVLCGAALCRFVYDGWPRTQPANP